MEIEHKEQQHIGSKRIAVSEIRASPFQPRREFARDDLEELAASIKEVGLLHPIVVRPIARNAHEVLYYELIAGERRLRAAELAGLTMIEANLLSLSDESAAKVALIENVQRIDLNPLEVAIALRKLIDLFQMNQEEVALKIGKKRSTVANYLRLLSLPKAIQEGLHAGSITMGHAKAILSVEQPELKSQLYHEIVNDKMSVREAERSSQKIMRQAQVRNKKNGDEKGVAEVDHLQSVLAEHFKTRVECAVAKDKKSGKLIVHFFSLDDLERICELAGLNLAMRV